MLHLLIQELVVGNTCSDDAAMAEWAQARAMLSPQWGSIHAACVHWKAATESVQEAIGSHLGLTEPSDERFPGPKALADDYRTASEFVAELFADFHGG